MSNTRSYVNVESGWPCAHIFSLTVLTLFSHVSEI